MNKVWMIVAGVALAGMGVCQAGSLAIFDHVSSGFQFTYPQEWKRTNGREKVTLTIPYDDVKRTAQIEVFAVTFWSDIQIWQTAQAAAAKTDNREVVKQWQEEILTVPILFSKTKWNDAAGEPMIADNSLIYAATRKRLAFRVVANAADWERTEAHFRNLLQSLKWESGIPKVIDPSKAEQEYFVPEGRSKETIWRVPAKLPVAPVPGDQKVEATASTIALLVRFANPWKATPELAFTHPEVAGTVSVRAYTALEADPPGQAVIKAGARSMEAFDKVAKRDEKGPLTNRAGSTYAVIVREGTGKGGPLLSLDAVVSSGDYYLLIHWESNDAKNGRKAKDKVLELVNSLSVEVKPSS